MEIEGKIENTGLVKAEVLTGSRIRYMRNPSNTWHVHEYI